MIAALLPRLFLWLWFFAVLIGGPHLLLRLPPAGLPATVLILTIAAIRVTYQFQGLRSWITNLSLRAIILVHVSRTAGLGLLVLHLRGIVEGDFAMPVGLGELAIGIMAIPVAFAPLALPQRLRAVAIWNIAGITDLILAVALASRMAAADADFFRALSTPPLVVIPLFAVPLLAMSHLELLLRGRRPSATPPRPAGGNSIQE